MEYSKLINHPVLLIISASAILLLLGQSLFFAFKSYKTGRKLGISESKMKAAIRGSAIASIGPSLAILSGMITLMVTIGVPIAWMRLSLIGSVMFESMAAGLGTSAMGIQLGSAEMTDVAFANAVWTMILASIGWIIFALLFTDKMDKVTSKITKGSSLLIMIMTIGATMGGFAYFSAERILLFNKETVSCIGGMIVMIAVIYIRKKKNIQWLKEWALTIAMVGGMLIGTFAGNLL